MVQKKGLPSLQRNQPLLELLEHPTQSAPLQHAFRTRKTSLPVDRLDPQDLEVLVVRFDPERRNVNVRVCVLLRNYCTCSPTCPDFPGGPGVPFVIRLGQKKKSHNQKQNYRISQSSLFALRPNVTNCTLNRYVIPLSNKKDL